MQFRSLFYVDFLFKGFLLVWAFVHDLHGVPMSRARYQLSASLHYLEEVSEETARQAYESTERIMASLGWEDCGDGTETLTPISPKFFWLLTLRKNVRESSPRSILVREYEQLSSFLLPTVHVHLDLHANQRETRCLRCGQQQWSRVRVMFKDDDGLQSRFLDLNRCPECEANTVDPSFRMVPVLTKQERAELLSIGSKELRQVLIRSAGTDQ